MTQIAKDSFQIRWLHQLDRWYKLCYSVTIYANILNPDISLLLHRLAQMVERPPQVRKFAGPRPGHTKNLTLFYLFLQLVFSIVGRELWIFSVPVQH